MSEPSDIPAQPSDITALPIIPDFNQEEMAAIKRTRSTLEHMIDFDDFSLRNLFNEVDLPPRERIIVQHAVKRAQRDTHAASTRSGCSQTNVSAAAMTVTVSRNNMLAKPVYVPFANNDAENCRSRKSSYSQKRSSVGAVSPRDLLAPKRAHGWRGRLNELLNNPKSSRYALAVSILLTFLILASVTVIILGTVCNETLCTADSTTSEDLVQKTGFDFIEIWHV